MWGLTADDIGMASFHGTSTLLNDRNESEVVSKQMAVLGRSEGNPILVVCQKVMLRVLPLYLPVDARADAARKPQYLTGHPKGPAASWMLNGVIQVRGCSWWWWWCCCC